MHKHETIIILALLVALAALGCVEAERLPTPTPTPDVAISSQPTTGMVNEPDTTPTPTATPTVPLPTATPTPRPTATPVATATPPPTPTPVQLRYQVFFDDIALAQESQAWRWEYDFFVMSGKAAEWEERYQILNAANVPDSEREKHWPDMCRDLDEQVYIQILHSIAISQDGPTWHVYSHDHAPVFDWHVGELRWFLIQECGEHVPYEPYPEVPEGTFDCANYDYREDAEEARWTYWYSDELQWDSDSPFLTLQYQPGFGTYREIICGYLPSRG